MYVNFLKTKRSLRQSWTNSCIFSDYVWGTISVNSMASLLNFLMAYHHMADVFMDRLENDIFNSSNPLISLTFVTGTGGRRALPLNWYCWCRSEFLLLHKLPPSHHKFYIRIRRFPSPSLLNVSPSKFSENLPTLTRLTALKNLEIAKAFYSHSTLVNEVIPDTPPAKLFYPSWFTLLSALVFDKITSCTYLFICFFSVSFSWPDDVTEW